MGVRKIKTEQRFNVKFAYNITATKLNTSKHVLGQNKQDEPQRIPYIHIWSCLHHLTVMVATEFTSGSCWYLCCFIFYVLRSDLSTIVFLFFYLPLNFLFFFGVWLHALLYDVFYWQWRLPSPQDRHCFLSSPVGGFTVYPSNAGV